MIAAFVQVRKMTSTDLEWQRTSSIDEKSEANRRFRMQFATRALIRYYILELALTPKTYTTD